MTTSNQPQSGRVIVSTFKLQPNAPHQALPTLSTSSVAVTTSSAQIVPVATTSASVVIHIDDPDAIRRANDALAGVVKIASSTSSGTAE